jgi:hypothetical protein
MMYDTLHILDMLFIVYVGVHKLEYMKNMVPKSSSCILDKIHVPLIVKNYNVTLSENNSCLCVSMG